MPKRDKDRQPDRDQGGPGGGGGGGLGGGDEDYDWIMYLGEGRAPSGAPSSAAQSPPDLPRRGRSGTSSKPDGGSRRAEKAAGREGRSVPFNDLAAGAGADFAAGPGADYAAGPPASRPGSGGSAAGPGRFGSGTGRQSGRRAAPQQYLPDGNDYAAPLYSDQPRTVPAREDRPEPWLDSDVYAKPLYPGPDTGQSRAIRDAGATRAFRGTGAGDDTGPTRGIRDPGPARATRDAGATREAGATRAFRDTGLGDDTGTTRGRRDSGPARAIRDEGQGRAFRDTGLTDDTGPGSRPSR